MIDPEAAILDPAERLPIEHCPICRRFVQVSYLGKVRDQFDIAGLTKYSEHVSKHMIADKAVEETNPGEFHRTERGKALTEALKQ